MNANYPLDCWYVAATSDELADGVLARRILDLPVLLYRCADGSVVAMEDRCVHRAYPLSDGHREGDRVVCGYHGFTYDPDGRCVAVPSQENPPLGARVTTFVTHEQAPFVWIWMGTPGGSQLRRPPATPWLDETAWWHVGERRHVAANFLLLHEHYLDLTNVFTMHPEVVPPDIQSLPDLDEVAVSEVSVSYTRTLPAAPLASWESRAAGVDSGALFGRRETGTFVTPGLHRQGYAIEGEDGTVLELARLHGFTPETPTSTHVFLRLAWRGPDATAGSGDALWPVFHEMAARDARVLETVQARQGENTRATRDVNVKADRAAVRARRIVESMVEDERGRSARA